MMFLKKITALLSAIALTGVAAAQTQESAILLKLLVKKGIITEQEASHVLAEMADFNSAPGRSSPVPDVGFEEVAPVSLPEAPDLPLLTAGKPTSLLRNLAFSNRMQTQFVHLNTEVAETALDPPHTIHFLLRRVYFGAKAQFAGGWSGNLFYDFAAGAFDGLYMEWEPNDALALQVGLRKAPIAYEEFLTSSGAIKPIERSAATRYFMEPNNGRRLGAGVYRQGVFLDGKKGNLQYALAVTNPERQKESGDVNGTGSKNNNNFSYWGFIGYRDSFPSGDYFVGVSAAILPDQGGKTLGAGDDLAVLGAFSDLNFGDLNIADEVFLGRNENGAGAGMNADPWGYWIQPSYRLGLYEFVFRYSHVDSDGRGISLSDGVRSAPSGGTMNTLDELFIGGNWYIRGNTLKLQAWYVYGISEDDLDGTPGKATAQGLRSQLQVSF